MSFTSISRNISMLAIAGMLSAGFVVADTVTVKQLALEKEGIELIGQLEDVARDIQFSAGQLQAVNVRGHNAKWTRHHHLMQIKDLVNGGLQPAPARLTEIQPELKEWQRAAIDKMLASANTLASDANSAILNQNENGNLPPLLNPEFKELIANVTHHAEALVKTADAAGDYAVALERAEEARRRVPKH